MVAQPPPYSRKILVVDDDADSLKLIREILNFEGYHVETSSSGEDGLRSIESDTPDLVLLDINMPGISGLEAIAALKQLETYMGVIFISARSKTQDIIAGLDSGADDYICKPFDPYELLARVRAQLRIKDLTDKLTAANKKLQELVDVDDLTGLFNMRSIYQRIDIELIRAQRYGRGVAAVMMDIDDFKQVNDRFDHVFGSYVLASVGKMIRDNVRQVDFAARYGGDEFLIILAETSLEGAVKFAQRLRGYIANHEFKNEEFSCRLTSSLGVAVIDPSAQILPAKELVRHADAALYEAKFSGKNRVCMYDSSIRTSSKLKEG